MMCVGDKTFGGGPASGRLATQVQPLVTAIIAGALAGLVAILTYQAMLLLQRTVWTTGTGDGDESPLRIFITIVAGGALLLLLRRIAPTESVVELLADSQEPRKRVPKRIAVTALSAIVAVAFGGAIGPEAGLLAVVAECSVVVSKFIARDEAQARRISQAGVAGVLGGLYGSPPAAAALDGDGETLAPSKLMSFVAGVCGFLVFVFMARNVFGGEGVATIPLPVSEMSPQDANPWLVIIPVLVGAALGLGFRYLHHGSDWIAAKIGRPWLVMSLGTVLFAGLAAAVPLVRFSGHHEMNEVPVLFSEGAAPELWLLAIAKVFALVLCLVTGWRGGEVFPLIFIGGAAGAAVALWLPGLDPAAAVAGAMAATLALGWKRPLASILILALVLDAGVALPIMIGIAVAVAVDRFIPESQSAELKSAH